VATSLVTELKRSKYRLLGLVGQGQFGRVYCAVHRKTGRLVALKELDHARFSTHKFLRELRFLLSLQHPSIVTCHALEHTRTGRYLVMDYCEGGTLRSLMENDIRLHPTQCLKLVTDVLAGLDHAHSRDIVHCDIKPENILLNLKTGGWQARISDFGISKLIQEMTNGETGNTGSPAYMAPERFYGQYSHSSDLYAVGILLYELLVGRRPFSGTPIELMSAHLNRPVCLPNTVPIALQSVILKALQKLQARRFGSARQMMAALQTAAITAGLHRQQPIHLFALEDSSSPPSAPTQVIWREELRLPVHHLAVTDVATGTQVFWLAGDRVGSQVFLDETRYQNDEQQQQTHAATIEFPDPVVDLKVTSSGGFVTTRQAVYSLSNLLSEEIGIDGDLATGLGFVEPQSIVQFDSHFLGAIAPEGHWLATATSKLDTQATQLRIWNTRGKEQGNYDIECPITSCLKLLALDSRHVAVFYHAQPGEMPTGTFVQVFTRRGYRLGTLHLSIALDRGVIASKTPYHIVGTELGDAHSLLLIDLKPLRMVRIPLEITPNLIAATDWGFVLADPEGQILLLDQYGERIGRIAGPANPTAIAPWRTSSLVIATWQDGRGSLHRLDLQEAGLDFLF
jgi:serine/threonine protein kinase